MTPNTTVCLSGTEPIIFGSDACNEGFYCPNNSAENPPQYCAPTPKCLLQRLQSAYNICAESQGRYEPIACLPGYYCPPGGKEQIICDKGYYCPLGSVKPFKCSALSVCPKGSSKELHTVGVLCCCLLDGLVLCLWLWPMLQRRLSSKRGKEKRDIIETPPVPSQDKHIHGLSSIFSNESSNITGLEMKFNISYHIKHSGRHILREISGTAQKSSLLGIMGPSGSGKSTLVNILSGKLRATSGFIFLQGVETSVSDLSKFKDLIGYVAQDDVVHPHLTVWENILFSARVRLGGVLKDMEIQQNVDQLIEALGLVDVRDTLVGDHERRGVSGGERKRISIGIELIAAPHVLILDEPTSGLDAKAALSIVMLLKSLSQYGITVICVLHQPRIEIFDCLDTLLLLASGKQIYFGKRSESKQYFRNMGYDFGSQSNPADMMLDIVGGSLYSIPPGELGCETTLIESSKKSSQVSSEASNLTLKELIALHHSHKTRMSPWYRQLYLCFSRDIRQQSRNSGSFLLEVFAGVLTGLLLGLALYEFQGHLYQGMFLPPFELLSSAVNYTLVPQLGVLCCLAISFASAAPSVTTFSAEKLLFRRESHSGHSESAYFAGKVLTSLLRTFLSALHFTTCYMILASPVISFGNFLRLNFLYYYCIYGLGSIVAALTKRENGPLACLLLAIVIGIFGGYAPRLAKVKEWHLAWFWYICPGTWFNEAFFTAHIWQFSYLYDREAADLYTGYTTGRTGFDVGVLLLMGTVYRVVGCSLMVIQARKSWLRWFR